MEEKTHTYTVGNVIFDLEKFKDNKIKPDNEKLEKNKNNKKLDFGDPKKWNEKYQELESKIEKDLSQLLEGKDNEQIIKTLKDEYKNLLRTNSILSDSEATLSDQVYILNSKIHKLKKYGTTKKENVKLIKRYLEYFDVENIFDVVMSFQKVVNELYYNILIDEGYLIKEEDRNSQDGYVIKKIEISMNSLLYRIKELEQKYESVLSSRITDLTTGKYDKMKKYSNNIKPSINKNPLNQKRKRGF